jgi:hypothetical protein
MVRLERVDTDRLDELVTDAWRMRAPSDLVAEADLGTDGTGQQNA